MPSGKIMVIYLIAEQLKTISSCKKNFYQERGSYSRNKIKVELDLLNFAIKSEVRTTTCFDKPKFVKKADLACLKTDFDKLDVDKLKNVPNYLSKSSTVVEKDVVKKTGYIYWLKKFLLLFQTNKTLKKTLKMLIKRYQRISKFIGTKEFNRSIKTDLNARMVVTQKTFATKNQGKTTVDLVDKNI